MGWSLACNCGYSAPLYHCVVTQCVLLGNMIHIQHRGLGMTGPGVTRRVARKTRGEFYSGFYPVRLSEGFLSGGFFPMSGQKLYEASLTYRGPYHT
jgi:hypothetical protein